MAGVGRDRLKLRPCVSCVVAPAPIPPSGMRGGIALAAGLAMSVLRLIGAAPGQQPRSGDGRRAPGGLTWRSPHRRVGVRIFFDRGERMNAWTSLFGILAMVVAPSFGEAKTLVQKCPAIGMRLLLALLL